VVGRTRVAHTAAAAATCLPWHLQSTTNPTTSGNTRHSLPLLSLEKMKHHAAQ